LRERKQLPAASEEALLAVRSPAPDAELQVLKQTSQKEFREALHAALAGLAPRERNILRLHYLDGIPAARIAELYEVNAWTISRAMSGAREKLFDETRRLLGERLRMSAAQIDSLVGLVMSRLDLSLSRVLKSEEEEEG